MVTPINKILYKSEYFLTCVQKCHKNLLDFKTALLSVNNKREKLLEFSSDLNLKYQTYSHSKHHSMDMLTRKNKEFILHLRN